METDDRRQPSFGGRLGSVVLLALLTTLCGLAALATAYNGASIGGVIFAPLWVAAIGAVGFPVAALISRVGIDPAMQTIPTDFGAIKDADFPLARDWRFFSREVFETAFAAQKANDLVLAEAELVHPPARPGDHHFPQRGLRLLRRADGVCAVVPDGRSHGEAEIGLPHPDLFA